MVFKNGLNDDLHLNLQLEAKFKVLYIISWNGIALRKNIMFVLFKTINAYSVSQMNIHIYSSQKFRYTNLS